MKAGVVSRTDIPVAADVTRQVIETLTSRDVKVFVETDTSLTLGMSEGNCNISDMDADFIVIVGGDGTILRTAMHMRDPETPLLGINLGRRGFLSEASPKDVERAIDRVLKGKYTLKDYFKLSSRCIELNQSFPDSLNEVLVASSVASKVIDMRLAVDNEKIIDIQSDGTIVATPTGSTAYSLSAGGSILAPEVPAMVVTAVCPDSYFRSIVLPIESRVKIKLLKPRTGALAIIDGQVQAELDPENTVEVWASPKKARFIRFGSFYKRLNRRLRFRNVLKD